MEMERAVVMFLSASIPAWRGVGVMNMVGASTDMAHATRASMFLAVMILETQSEGIHADKDSKATKP